MRIKNLTITTSLVIAALLVSLVPAQVWAQSPPQVIVGVPVLNVRSGPSTAYRVIGSVRQGERYDITGRSGDRQPWWLICCIQGGLSGWVTGDLVTTSGDTANVPIIAVTPPPATNTWRASYFNNTAVSGQPSAVVDVPDINFNWGSGAPAANIRVDNWSARFERAIPLNSNSYQFNIQGDGGLRVWLNNQLVIDAWYTTFGQTFSFTRQLSGQPNFRIEYFHLSGNAFLKFWWTAAPPPPPPAPPLNAWQASYFNDIYLQPPPLIVRNEDPQRYNLSRNWSLDSPVPGVVPADNWSAKWVGRWEFQASDYYFELKSRDGAKLYLDGLLVIDSWRDGESWDNNFFRRVGGGVHTVTIEYYKRGGLAWVEANWYPVAPGGVQPH